MLRLAYYDDEPDTYRFPAEAARLLRNGWTDPARPAPARPGDAHPDRDSSEAARRVEAAMKEVELRFSRLRDLMGFPEEDPDRPRAA
jgi:hypothetical protein